MKTLRFSFPTLQHQASPIHNVRGFTIHVISPLFIKQAKFNFINRRKKKELQYNNRSFSKMISSQTTMLVISNTHNAIEASVNIQHHKDKTLGKKRKHQPQVSF